MSCNSHPGNRGKLRGLCAAALVWLAATAAAIAQCPMCKSSVENSQDGGRLAGNLNGAILFLFAMPFAIIGAIALLIVRRRRKNR